jgi:tRNA threonylcarbamoyladenosine dehydratase
VTEALGLQRRFTSGERLYGAQGLARLANAHVVVVGIGGVGSWAAEALARSGVGRLTLIDADHAGETNINRQVLALESTLGMAKTEAMRLRILDISPSCVVHTHEEFLAPDNLNQLIPSDASAVIDAIDAPRAKAALIADCVKQQRFVVVSGAAGGRRDGLALRSGDIAFTRGDALLSGVRSRLRRDYNFSRDLKASFGVTAIYSQELLPNQSDTLNKPAALANGGAPLNCAGYGSSVLVTAPMGFALAGCVIEQLMSNSTHRTIKPLKVSGT